MCSKNDAATNKKKEVDGVARIFVLTSLFALSPVFHLSQKLSSSSAKKIQKSK